MNILLIDDQPNIISSLVAGIPWREMGFTSIFTATSASRARDILTAHTVDVVVSDIEMPQEDGLSLLSWARKQGYDYECILLTAHADFFYAQQAITLKVSEYVIQPARNEDIIHAVKNAIQNIERKDRMKHRLNTDNFNYAAQNIVIKTLFDEWPSIEESIIHPETLKSRIAQLTHFGVHVDEHSSCLIIMIHTRKWKKLPLTAADFLSRYLQLLQSVFIEVGTHNISYYVNENTFFTVVFTPKPSDVITLLPAIYNSIPERIGATVRMAYAPSELRFIRNTMDGILKTENDYALSHSADDIHLYEVNKDDLYHAAIGGDNITHYAKLIKDYIRDKMSEPITRSDIADHLHISPDHVSLVIKTTEDVNVKELITKIKMEHARGLLRNTKNTIGEIAQKCGYDSFAYFSKVYRDTYGITPSQERHE